MAKAAPIPYKGGMEGEAGRAAARPDGHRQRDRLLIVLGSLGVVSIGLSLVAVRPVQFNIVRYDSTAYGHPHYWVSTIFAAVVVTAVLVLCVWAASRMAAERRPWVANSSPWPLLLSVPLATYAFVEQPPPFFLGLLMIPAVGWTALRAVKHIDRWPSFPWSHQLAMGSIVLLIALLTVIHTRIQVNFYEHFMLGHADIGHFTEELKNALVGRGLRSDSFENTRLGWHFVPLLYLLVPGYALWPSPVYLMVCGPLFVHIVALPVYYLARRLSGSALVGWMFGVAWLLLPSQSRLIYANTYGFPWPTVLMPLLTLMIAAGLTGRWRTSLAVLVLVLLARETAAAATLGWGLYVALFTPRRKTGVAIGLASVLYFLLCSMVLIPHFAAAGHYERLELYGDLGTTVPDLVVAIFAQPGEFFGRLVRREVFYCLLVLMVPMALLPIRGWRVALGAVPALVMVLLLQNEQWLSIKFWHQCAILPFLFTAGIASMGASEGRRAARNGAPADAGHAPRDGRRGLVSVWLAGRRARAPGAVHHGIAAAALVCAALGHYLYGFSPMSKPFEVYAASTHLQTPDPRLEIVRRLRSELSTDRTVLATERLAFHFTGYKRLYTGGRIRPVDYVLIDRSDRWDTSGLPQKVSLFASDPDYRVYGEFGSIVVFERVPHAPRPAPD